MINSYRKNETVLSNEQKIQMIFRTLQILYINYSSKINEIKHQDNRCIKCKSYNINYSKNNPSTALHIYDIKSNFFRCNGLIFWQAKCNDCNNSLSIIVSCKFDKELSFKLFNQGLFLNEHGGCGHYNDHSNNIHLIFEQSNTISNIFSKENNFFEILKSKLYVTTNLIYEIKIKK